VVLVRSDVSEKCITIIRVTRIDDLGTTLAETKAGCHEILRIILCMVFISQLASVASYCSVVPISPILFILLM
jgi:hypothetical protein